MKPHFSKSRASVLKLMRTIGQAKDLAYDWCREESVRLKRYIESDRFEEDLDRYANSIGLNFSRFSELRAKNRKLRISIKSKLILERCATRVGAASSIGGIVGLKFGGPSLSAHFAMVAAGLACGELFFVAVMVFGGKTIAPDPVLAPA